jgi:lysophospholipase L1-like esterase
VVAVLGTLLSLHASAAELEWRPAQELRLEGRAWSDVAAPFDRLPARAESIARPPVWSLSRQSAGIAVRFVTDSPEIHARWTLTSASLAMPHMPATGVSGLDLYVRLADGRWSWLANGRPSAVENTAKLVGEGPPGSHEFLVYFPLYNGVKSVEIGVPSGKKLEVAPTRPDASRKPIVFWGTSITQGGCASRPGMVHTAILGRRLDREVVNLGFSGNGKMEPELAQVIAEIDAAAFVIDCLPNMTAAEVAERTAPLVKILRQRHPNTPILLVEDRTYSDAFWVASKRMRNDASRAALKKSYEQLVAEGVAHLIYVTGEEQLGADTEGTVDSSHPTDLGFVRMADWFEPPLRRALGQN